MLKLGITGAAGFLGWHLRVHLFSSKDVEVVPAGRDTFSDPAALRDFVNRSDVIVHLAGMNRGDDGEIERVNVDLVQTLIAACETAKRRPHIVFANSTHYDRDTAYARSKRRCVELLGERAARGQGGFCNLIMPGLFGEKGRPFYNAVTSTFCHQTANGERPKIIEDREIELVHAQDVAARIVAVARNRETGNVRIDGRAMTVTALLARIETIAEQYGRSLIPDLRDGFDLALFNTYRSYLFPRHYPVVLPLRADARGQLFESVKTIHGGQCFVSTTHPGITRGNHYHRYKIERFLVIQGEANIRVRELLSRQAVEFRVSGERPAYIDMPTFHTHDITNVGSGELITLFWAHEIFDANTPDTYPEPV